MTSTTDSTWTASFIASAVAHDTPGLPAPYFRTEFDVAPDLVRARLHVTALGLVEVHCNGTVIGDEVLVPGWTSYDHRTIVREHDVTSLLMTGANAVGAIAGEGWAVGRVSHLARRNVWADRPAVFVQLELEYPDRTEVIGSDETWTTAPGAITADGIYDGESYDARREPRGWSEAGFDDGDWTPVVRVERDLSSLTTTDAPPIRRTQELSPADVSTLPSGELLVDFGQVIAGWVRLQVEGDAGTTVTVRHTEFVANGEPDYEPNRSAEATDRYTLSGDGLEVWEPRFTFHGFRYAVIDGWPGDLEPHAITAVVIHSDLRRTGWFECSDEQLNRLHQNIVWSWRGNSVGLPTDCPQRDERLGWTGDINAFAPTATFLYDTRTFLGGWLDDLALEQLDKGIVPVVVPDVLDQFTAPTALWGDVAVSLPWQLYQQHGDLEMLRQRYESMKAFIDGVAAVLDPDGRWTRGFQFGDWLDPDAPPDKPSKAKAESELVATAYLCKTTAELTAAARLLGHAEDAATYDALHTRVRDGFRAEWVAPSGRLANESQTSYALAICFGILDDGQQRRAGARLAQLVKDAGHRISTGFAGTPLVTHALSRTGHDDVAYAMLQQTEPPSFLYPVTMGATTIWERWDSVLPDGTLNSTGMTSLNHYALGAIGDWMHQYIGGIRRREPGYRAFALAPRPGGGLTWARAVLDTSHGRIACEWRDEAQRRTVSATVPPDTTATVTLPDHPEALAVDVGPGDHTWSYELPPEAPWDLSTPFERLRTSELVWDAVYDAVGQLMPGVPNLLDYLADGAPDLATALPHLPDVSPDAVADVLDAIRTADPSTP